MKIRFVTFSLLAMSALLFSCQPQESTLAIHDSSLPLNERVEGTYSGDLLYAGDAVESPIVDYTVKAVEAISNSEDILIDGLRFQLHSVDYPDYDFVRFIHEMESPAYATFTFSTAALKFEWATATQHSIGTLYLR